jgi:hypothetical protein
MRVVRKTRSVITGGLCLPHRTQDASSAMMRQGFTASGLGDTEQVALPIAGERPTPPIDFSPVRGRNEG